MERHVRTDILRYLVAILATGCAVAAHAALTAWLGVEDLLLFLVSAVLLAAGSGGLGPGLLATTISAAVGGYALLPHDFGDRVRLVLFVLISVTISVASEFKRRAERDLRAADTQKNRFLATLAHELRTPLAPVRNALQIVRNDGPPSATVQWACGVAERQIEHMVRLVDDLVDVHRIGRNQLELRIATVDLVDVVDAAVEASRPAIEARSHRLNVRLPDEPIRLDADSVRLSQVLTNLLNNAARYTPDGGTIGLEARRDGGDVVMRVSDNGLGITTEHLPHLFEPFYRGERASAHAPGGLGIGLSLTRDLVALHGGTITADSAGRDRGAAFTVRLPVPETAAARRAALRPAHQRAST